jgi:hypothetical protein
MFLIKEQRLGTDYFVFTHTDPRKEGYRGEVIDGVSLDYDMNAVHLWPDGEPFPEPQLGRDPTNAKHYKVFKFPHELHASGYEFVHVNTPIVAYSLRDYRRMFPVLAEMLDQAEWDTDLDEIDETTKRRRQADLTLATAPTGGRDSIAEWVAKRHLIADGSIREVWYLPTTSPPDELRLLEVNERLPTPSSGVEPIDFGLEVEGKSYKLLVADVTRDQLEMMKRDSSNMPKGWNFLNARSWGRRQ